MRSRLVLFGLAILLFVLSSASPNAAEAPNFYYHWATSAHLLLWRSLDDLAGVEIDLKGDQWHPADIGGLLALLDKEYSDPVALSEAKALWSRQLQAVLSTSGFTGKDAYLNWLDQSRQSQGKSKGLASRQPGIFVYLRIDDAHGKAWLKIMDRWEDGGVAKKNFYEFIRNDKNPLRWDRNPRSETIPLESAMRLPKPSWPNPNISELVGLGKQWPKGDFWSTLIEEWRTKPPGSKRYKSYLYTIPAEGETQQVVWAWFEVLDATGWENAGPVRQMPLPSPKPPERPNPSSAKVVPSSPVSTFFWLWATLLALGGICLGIAATVAVPRVSPRLKLWIRKLLGPWKRAFLRRTSDITTQEALPASLSEDPGHPSDAQGSPVMELNSPDEPQDSEELLRSVYLEWRQKASLPFFARQKPEAWLRNVPSMIANLQAKVDELENNLQVEQGSLRSANVTISDLKTSNDNLIEQVETLKCHAVELGQQRDAANEAVKEAKRKFSSIERAKNKIDGDLEVAQQRLEDVNLSYGKARADWEIQRKSLKAAEESIRGNLIKSQEECRALRTRATDAETNSQQLQRDIALLGEAAARLQSLRRIEAVATFMRRGQNQFLDETEPQSAGLLAFLINHSLNQLTLSQALGQPLKAAAMLRNLRTISSKLAARYSGFQQALPKLSELGDEGLPFGDDQLAAAAQHEDSKLFQLILRHLRTAHRVDLAPFYFDVTRDGKVVRAN